MIDGLEEEVRNIRGRVLELATVEATCKHHDHVDAVEVARDNLRDALTDFATSWQVVLGTEVWTMTLRKPEEPEIGEDHTTCQSCRFVMPEERVRCPRCGELLGTKYEYEEGVKEDGGSARQD